MSLEGLEMTDRGAATAVAEPPPQTAPPPPPAQEPVITPTPPPVVQVTESKPDTFMADLLKGFEKQAPQTEPSTQRPPEPALKAAEEPKTSAPSHDGTKDEFGLPEPPKAFSKGAKDNWDALKKGAHEQIRTRENRIKDLEREVEAQKQSLTVDQSDVNKLREELTRAHQIIEQTAIERSPVFKERILDQQELVRGKLTNLAEGTSLSANDVNRLINGDLKVREEILEAHQLSSYRKNQTIDLLGRWDQIEEQKGVMLATGKQSREQYLARQKAEEDSRRAQFMRESAQYFEDEMTTFAPTLEPYQPIDGQPDWNNTVNLIKTYARKIFSGNIDKKALAQTAILAPAAAVYSKVIVPNLIARVKELESQVDRMRGVAPGVSDRGGDRSEPASLSSPNGDFVKGLVDRFRKEAGA